MRLTVFIVAFIAAVCTGSFASPTYDYSPPSPPPPPPAADCDSPQPPPPIPSSPPSPPQPPSQPPSQPHPLPPTPPTPPQPQYPPNAPPDTHPPPAPSPPPPASSSPPPVPHLPHHPSIKGKIHYIIANNFGKFVPDILNIKKGDTVIWKFIGVRLHDITQSMDKTGCSAKPGGFKSAIGMEPMTYSKTFDSGAGEFPYFCTPSCALGMRGVINVQD
ncbi:hypothetical protein GQ42DRAFT_10892 [Ramicandelaber brevisporus]|nr:hypothetical protein GQ42DRAFT_10892 [Ramicandelaber brevisporus]